MSLSESKSNLARLLAEEDLIVEQRKGVSSAFFDTKSRLLVIPTLKEDLSSEVVDLFISHEVGHALFTPVDWLERTKTVDVKKSIINVVEDARIERMVKQRFPGLRVIYSKAYRNLMEMDFFGISRVDFESMNLIDKINLFFKIGFHSEISFDEIEQKFVDRAGETKTFEDVLVLSKEIQNYMKEQYEKQMDEEGNSFDEDFDADYDFANGLEVEYSFDDSETESEESESELEEMFKSETESGVADSAEESMDSELEQSSKKDFLDKALESMTSNNSEENIKELFSESSKQSLYIDIPHIDSKQYVVDYREIYTRLKKAIPEEYTNRNAYNIFKRDNASIVSYLIKEFQLKKNAEGRKKIKISKTGELNLNKIFAYKTSDDIFKRNEIVPKSQSHGLVFFLDWSGSMEDYLNDTIKQMIAMMLFCKKLNIPFEVYAFTTQFYKVDENERIVFFRQDELKMQEMIINPLHLMNLFSSRMSNNEFISACNYLLSFNYSRFSPQPLKKGYYYNYSNDNQIVAPRWFLLGNTPLNHSIILSKYVVEEFKERSRVQKVNAIFMTDGDSHGITFNTPVNNTSYVRNYGIDRTDMFNIYLRDKKSKVTHRVTRSGRSIGETNNCVEFLKKISNFNVFGFRLVSKKDFKRCYSTFVGCDEKYTEYSKKFTKENCLKSTATSFDDFYLVKANSINEGDETLSNFEEKETQASIARKFQKVLEAKVNNRIFLKKFIEFIS